MSGYYPGSSCDGDAIKLFGSSYSAHCWGYWNYLMQKTEIKKALDGYIHEYNMGVPFHCTIVSDWKRVIS